MEKTKLKTLPSILCCAALLNGIALTSNANAQDLRGHSRESDEARVHEIFQLQSQRDSIHKGGPVTGAVFSSLAIVVGLPVLGVGLAHLGGDSQPPVGDPFDCNFVDCSSGFTKKEARNTTIAGAVITSVGAIGLAFSARAIHNRNDEIRKLEAQLRELEATGTRVSVSYGAPQKPALLHF